jgi:hypothetical protein
MKKILILLILGCFRMAYAQNAAINSDGSAAHSSAILDVKATDKGVLFPRMTKAQRDAIPSPTEGLMVYQTDNVKGVRVYNGTNWVLLTPAVATIKDVKASGTKGGTSTAGAWQTRDLNTLDDPFGVVTSLNTNQFTLPTGRYFIEATLQSYLANRNRSALYNVTNNAYFEGSSNLGGSGDFVVSLSIINTYVTVTAVSNTFEIRQFSQTSKSLDGLGVEVGITAAGAEVYTQVKITKIE